MGVAIDIEQLRRIDAIEGLLGWLADQSGAWFATAGDAVSASSV
jgi:hypothetical protein